MSQMFAIRKRTRAMDPFLRTGFLRAGRNLALRAMDRKPIP